MFTYFNSKNGDLNEAFRIAIGDLTGNIVPFRDGLLEEKKPCVLAGLDYDSPWTRDTAINVWNGVGLLYPDVAKNTLTSILEKNRNVRIIGGQYWDKIIWVVGAWQYILMTGDLAFMETVYEAVSTTLSVMEQEEFDEKKGLFRGPAVYGDGVAAYPDKYAENDFVPSGILDWPRLHLEQKAGKGFGIPMCALSTNCVYYEAYRICAAMTKLLNMDDSGWKEKADQLKNQINRYFWNNEKGSYRYLVDDTNCDHQEGLGLAFTLLFDIADQHQTESILKNTVITEHGIACVWPSFSRYINKGGYGRHSGVIWPHVQGFWAAAVRKANDYKLFEKEFWSLTKLALASKQFAEIYHPETGVMYGGLQEDGGTGIREWKSCNRQTWSATAYLSMIIYGLFGMEFTWNGVWLKPHLPEGIDEMELIVPYRKATLHIEVSRNTAGEKKRFIPAETVGDIKVEL